MITIWRRWPSSVSSKKSRSISVWITSACSLALTDIATAAVKLACGEEVKAEAANGNGPVDAVYQAINRITDYNIELVKYSLTAKGHGETPGQVDIVANYNGRRFHGVGLATDIVVLRQSHGARTEQYLACRRSRKRVATQSSTQRKQQGNRVMSKNYHIAVLPGDGIGPE